MKSDQARIIYQSHKDGLRLVSNLCDATEFQKTFLQLMAVKEIEYKEKIDVRLTGIAKGVGIEFKDKKR